MGARALLAAGVLCSAGCASAPPAPEPFIPTAGYVAFRLPLDEDGLRTVARMDVADGGIAERRAVLAGLHRGLLMDPPADGLVPELFDLITLMAPRMAAGEIRETWAAYVYTTYQRDLVRDRPGGDPRRAEPEIATALADYAEYYRLQAREDVQAPASGDPVLLSPTWRGRSVRPRAGSRGY